MVRRRKKETVEEEQSEQDYFDSTEDPKQPIPRIHTGCVLLDCVLGGGWPLGRIVNLVGDKSTGKTLLAIESCANFAKQYPDGTIWYRESEAAFDIEYAEDVGLPIDRVDFGPEGLDSAWETIEEVFTDLEKCIAEAEKTGNPGLYIIDSLDALTTTAALERQVGDTGYKLEKPKLMSEMFAKLKGRVKRTRTCVIFISQIRDKIGMTFGEKYTRSGGKALDFYSTQILWLSHLKTINRTRGGSKRAVAIQVMAKCKKNKAGYPFRSCEFPIRFGFGIQDLVAVSEWLKETKNTKLVDLPLDDLDELTHEEYAARQALVRPVVVKAWAEIDHSFQPKFKKYA